MAISNLNEIIQSHIMRRNAINRELAEYSTQKSLAVYQQADLTAWHNNQRMKTRREWQDIYTAHLTPERYNIKDKNGNLQGNYLLGSYCLYNGNTYYDYSELEEYNQALAMVDSQYSAELEELTSWETQLDAQITNENTELAEIEAYLESFKTMLSNNIKNDYQYASQ